MSTLTLTHHATGALRTLLHAPARRRPVPARAKPSFLDRLDRWFDGVTDDRVQLERYLAQAQNLADLEIRMREALTPRPPLRF